MSLPSQHTPTPPHHQSPCQIALLHGVSMTTAEGPASRGNFSDETCQSFPWLCRIRFGFGCRNLPATAKAQLLLFTPTYSSSLIISAPHLHLYFNLEPGRRLHKRVNTNFCYMKLSYEALQFLGPELYLKGQEFWRNKCHSSLHNTDMLTFTFCPGKLDLVFSILSPDVILLVSNKSEGRLRHLNKVNSILPRTMQVSERSFSLYVPCFF